MGTRRARSWKGEGEAWPRGTVRVGAPRAELMDVAAGKRMMNGCQDVYTFVHGSDKVGV